jgi:hypothetical protein
MSITRDPVQLTLTKSGTSLEFWWLSRALPARAYIHVGCYRTSDQITVGVRSSGDGRSCFRCGVIGTNLVVIKREFGVETTVASTANLLPGNETYTLRVRLNSTQNAINVAVLRSNAVVAELTYTTTDYLEWTGYGVFFFVDGSLAYYVGTGELKDQISSIDETNIAVIAGTVWAARQPSQWRREQSSVFPVGSRVKMRSLIGKMWMIGGGLAKYLDPILSPGSSIADWVPSSGTLPGQSLSGTTTATLLEEHQGGLVLAGMPENSTGYHGSAIGDPLNYDDGGRLYGSSFSRGLTDDDETVAEPIVALAKAPDNSLMLAGQRNVYYLLGDVYGGGDQLVNPISNSGASGPDSITIGEVPSGQEALVMHGAGGLSVCFAGQSPIVISRDVLNRYLTIDPADLPNYRIVAARDPQLRAVFIFGLGGVNIAYFERIGKYADGEPAFYPFTLPVDITAAKVIRGKLILGTSDGRLVRFDPVLGDDLGNPVRTVISSEVVKGSTPRHDAIIRRMQVVTGAAATNATVTIYGAQSAEDLFNDDKRATVWASHAIGDGIDEFSVQARRAYMVATVEVETTGRGAILEAWNIDDDEALRSRHLGPDQVVPVRQRSRLPIVINIPSVGAATYPDNPPPVDEAPFPYLIPASVDTGGGVFSVELREGQDVPWGFLPAGPFEFGPAGTDIDGIFTPRDTTMPYVLPGADDNIDPYTDSVTTRGPNVIFLPSIDVH